MHPVIVRKSAQIRDSLRRHGTNVDQNDLDPTGDGDQSEIHLSHEGKQVYRNLFAEGGDFHEYAECGGLSTFASACITGNVANVEALLKQASGADSSKPSQALIRLLETRETSMRVSPLLMIVSLGKNVGLSDKEGLARGQVAVAAILLKYGARPDAKDVCGKTVCHYGAGQMATDVTLQIVDNCICAAKSCQLFGKEVELHGLSNESMNGKRGIARGYIADRGRRAVYVLDERKEMAIKPDNIRLVGAQNEVEPRPKLCDVQDRLGSVSLLEVFMTGREDVAKFLLDQHDARIDVADFDGCSPKSMALSPGAQLTTSVGPMIMKRAMKHGRAEKKAATGQCSKCGTVETATVSMAVCARCKAVQYCSKECQVADWKAGHKQVCKKMEQELATAIQLETLPADGLSHVTFSFSTRKAATSGTYRRPDSVAVGEQFYIKVQALPSDTQPLLIYDKSRQFEISYPFDRRGYREMYNAARGERATNGTKTYLKASFDASGSCTVYPGTTSIKTW
jgi:hypothetical protein